jgi:hypothetical protein
LGPSRHYDCRNVGHGATVPEWPRPHESSGEAESLIRRESRRYRCRMRRTKPKPPAIGLSVRAKRCLAAAGIPAEKEAVLHALKTGALYPFFRPPLYGITTHEEVCRWAGADESFESLPPPKDTMPPIISNGLSFRANRFLHRAGIPAEKEAVRHALQTGMLRPGKGPMGYGRQTHAELCRWVGVDASILP